MLEQAMKPLQPHIFIQNWELYHGGLYKVILHLESTLEISIDVALVQAGGPQTRQLDDIRVAVWMITDHCLCDVLHGGSCHAPLCP